MLTKRKFHSGIGVVSNSGLSHRRSVLLRLTPTVVYNVDGSPITKESLVKRAKSASQRVKSGDYITQEEIEKEIENW